MEFKRSRERNFKRSLSKSCRKKKSREREGVFLGKLPYPGEKS